MTKEVSSLIEVLFQQLMNELNTHGSKIAKGFQGVVRFVIGDETWTLELLDDTKRLTKGKLDSEPDVEIEASEEDFVKLVMGKISPQTAFMLGKLHIAGDISLALKVQPLLEAARPKSKL